MAIWKTIKADKELVRAISKKYSCDTLTACILVKRGIISDEEIPYFLSDDPWMLRDPFCLPDMSVAIDRIIRAKALKEKVLIFGDRDTDGISGTVMLFDYLLGLGIDVGWYLPVSDEPYGLSQKSVEDFSADGGSLIITVDCGISNNREIDRANELGVDVIVTDHHEPKDGIPSALAVINPKLPNSAYPFRDICGCVVAYKLVCALQSTLTAQGVPDFARRETNYLQLAALGTVADIMPLKDENRIYVRKGLKLLIEKPMNGISELLLILGLSGKPLSAKELSWILCPAINAAGRMGCPEKAIALLLEKDARNRLVLANELKALNEQRRKTGTKTWPVVEKLASESITRFGGKLVLAADEKICRGITGIMANRLIEKCHIPAMVVHLGENLAIGSIRSPGNYDIRLLLEPLDDVIKNYGGHKDALGFSMERSLWEQYVDRLEIEIETIPLKEIPVDDSLVIDAELPHRYIVPDILNVVDRFEPYGEGNKPLVFASRGLKVIDFVFMGKSRPKHIKYTLDTGEFMWPAILWNGMEKAGENINGGDSINMAYTFCWNWYRGIKSPQIIIEDIVKAPGGNYA